MKDLNFKGKVSPRLALEERRRMIKKKKIRNKNILKTTLCVLGLTTSIYGITILSGNAIKSEAMESKSTKSMNEKIQSVEPIDASIQPTISSDTEVQENENEDDTQAVTVVKESVQEEVTSVQETKEDELPKETAEDKPAGIYNEKIPMSEFLQEYLYRLCKNRGLDYKKTLAIIHHESRFNPDVINETNDYGYFQINIVNHEDLAYKTVTDNMPLNPITNINWGTYMLADLYAYWEKQGITGEELDKHVWSSYNRGITGFKNNGYAYNYIQKVKESIKYINSMY